MPVFCEGLNAQRCVETSYHIQTNVHNDPSLCAEDKVTQTQWAEVKHILFAYQYKGPQQKKKTSLEFLCQVQHIAAAADCCKNVRGYIQEVGMYFFVIKETWAGCVTPSVNLPGILWHGWDCSSTLKLEERVERCCYYTAIDCWNRFT